MRELQLDKTSGEEGILKGLRAFLEDHNIRLRSTGKLMDEPEVYIGLNMMVLVEDVP